MKALFLIILIAVAMYCIAAANDTSTQYTYNDTYQGTIAGDAMGIAGTLNFLLSGGDDDIYTSPTYSNDTVVNTITLY